MDTRNDMRIVSNPTETFLIGFRPLLQMGILCQETKA